ncbi:MAG: ABC transporter permease [Dehalococcoidia bacterium]
MSELFGLSMQTIMLVLLALFLVSATASVALLLTGRIMLKMGIRNIARRRAQSILIISGLMLATTIITAAFTTGDTIDYSVLRTTYDNLQRSDLSLHHFQADDVSTAGGDPYYAPDDLANRLATEFQGDPDIEGFFPFLFEPTAVFNARTKLNTPFAIVAGSDPELLNRFGGLRFVDGSPANLADLKEGEVYADNRLADELDATVGDELTLAVRGGQKTVRIAGIVREERATGTLEFGGGEMPGIAARMETVQQIFGREGLLNSISVALYGGVRGTNARSAPATARLEAFISVPENAQRVGLSGGGFQVEEVKANTVEEAKVAASAFTSVFLLLGLFSIASGVLLIFMIFVMLAAERQREMGITRAVGALRIHLVQAFLAEGMVYAFLAGLVGVAVGVAFGLLVVVGGSKLAFGDDLAWLSGHVTVRTLIVSFCLGWVSTFTTVVVSAVVVSRLNIVAAIRGQVASAVSTTKRKFRPWWLLGSIPFMVILPLGLYMLLRRAFGLSRTWTIGPAGIAVGLGLMPLGRATDSSFLFSSGLSLVPISAGLLVRKAGVPDRAVWTTVGVALSCYWLMPLQVSEKLFGKFDNSGMEMFVFSGIMIVTALTLIIVFNARFLNSLYSGSHRGRGRYALPVALALAAIACTATGIAMGDAGEGTGGIVILIGLIVGVGAIFSFVGQRFTNLAPALRMGIAYPLANRFRTGMTIAMFSLILFSITVMSVLNASFLDIYTGDEGQGGWDVIVNSNRNNPITDLPAALGAAGATIQSKFTAIGGITPGDDDRQTVRQPGAADWEYYIVRAADDNYWDTVTTVLEARADGYASDRAVFDAVRNGTHLAVMEYAPLELQQGLGGEYFSVKGVKVEDHSFKPFDLEIRNEATRDVMTVTVIGLYSNKIPPGLFPGITINAQSSTDLFGPPDFRQFLVRLQPGTDGVEAARAIEAALSNQGVEADSIHKVLEDAVAAQRGFLRVLQLFMALGLVVGIAAIGVISLRSVVERRQQIGMLRAIGYERGTVALSFLFESVFVSLMGIGSGVLGAVILSRNLIASEALSSTSGVALLVPWPEVLAFAGAAFAFAVAMTWWPSRRAAGVAIAEALRYE